MPFPSRSPALRTRRVFTRFVSALAPTALALTMVGAAAASEMPWHLYVNKSGVAVADYENVAACLQAAATQSKGVLRCRPDPAEDKTDAKDPQAPVVAPSPGLKPPSMGNMLPIDSSRLPQGSIAYPTERLQPTHEVAPASDIGAFRTVCAFSHMAFDDPIVRPNEPGASHLHAFFGNTGTNAFSTAQSIRTSGDSTCRGGIINRTAYWVPAMIDMTTGQPVQPDSSNFYYKRGYQISRTAPIHALPPGLRMVAGDPANASASGNAAHRFRCQGGPRASNDQYGPSIPNCDAGAKVVQEVFFPQCWDGKNLDAPDHKSHMSYPVQLQKPPFTWSCPATHPVVLPQITFNIDYTVPSKGAALQWRLASDTYDRKLPGGYSSHGDWFNGWQQAISDTWAHDCIAARRDCHSHLIGDGRMMY